MKRQRVASDEQEPALPFSRTLEQLKKVGSTSIPTTQEVEFVREFVRDQIDIETFSVELFSSVLRHVHCEAYMLKYRHIKDAMRAFEYESDGKRVLDKEADIWLNYRSYIPETWHLLELRYDHTASDSTKNYDGGRPRTIHRFRVVNRWSSHPGELDEYNLSFIDVNARSFECLSCHTEKQFNRMPKISNIHPEIFVKNQ